MSVQNAHAAIIKYHQNMCKEIEEAHRKMGQIIGDMTAYIYERMGNKVKALQARFNAELNNFVKIEGKLGVHGINFDNFIKRMKESLNRHFSPERVDLWQQLGNSLKQLDEYNKQLKEVSMNTSLVIRGFTNTGDVLGYVFKKWNELGVGAKLLTKHLTDALNPKDASRITKSIRSLTDEFARYGMKFTHTLRYITGGLRGTYKDVEEFLNRGLGKKALSLFNRVLGGHNNLDRIYKIWEGYAKEINSTVTDAIQNTLRDYLDFKDKFKVWFLKSHGDMAGAIQYQIDQLNKVIDYYKSRLGVANVTVDNFMQMFDNALKSNLTPDTVKTWQALGEALMQATDLSKELSDALFGNNDNRYQNYDVMLGYQLSSRGDFLTINRKLERSSEDSRVLLYKILKELKFQTRLIGSN